MEAVGLIDDGGVRGYVRTPWYPTVVQKSAQQGALVEDTARLVGDAVAPGCWVALSLRRLVDLTEGDGWEKFVTRRIGAVTGGTHHSREKGHVVSTIVGGGSTRAEVRDCLTRVAAALPGFDVSCSVRFATRVPRSWVWAVAVVSGLVAWVCAQTSERVDEALRTPGAGHALASAGVWGAVAGVCVAVLWMVGVWPGFITRVGAARQVWRLPRPPWKWWLTRGPRSMTPADMSQTLLGARSDHKQTGGYPLRRCDFVLGPMLPAAFVAPGRGVESGVVSAEVTRVPPEVTREGMGPVFAAATDGTVARLSSPDMWAGVAVSGKSGTGKTGFLSTVWGAYLADHVDPQGWPGWPGADSTLIAFESKGDGLDDWRRWAALTGCPITVVSLTRPGTSIIDVLGVHPDPLEAAKLVTASMKGVFDDGIQALAMETLTGVWSGALVADEAVFAHCGDEPARLPVEVAAVLCGCKGAERARRMFLALAREAVDSDDPVRGARLREAVELLSPVFGTPASPTTPSQFANQTGSSRNKINALLKARGWWARSDTGVTWRDIVSGRQVVVVDVSTGTGVDVLDEETASVFASILGHTLWTTIKQECSGWRRQGRRGCWFVDELSLVCKSSPELYPWFVNQGRSSGWEALVATQYLDQLDTATQTAFLTAATSIAMTQTSVPVSDTIARHLGGGVTGDTIRHLPKFAGVCRVCVDQVPVPVFTATILDWDADPAAVIRMNGHTTAPADFHGRFADIPLPALAPAPHTAGPRVDPGPPATGPAEPIDAPAPPVGWSASPDDLARLMGADTTGGDAPWE